jgi:hypothetical protein
VYQLASLGQQQGQRTPILVHPYLIMSAGLKSGIGQAPTFEPEAGPPGPGSGARLR